MRSFRAFALVAVILMSTYALLCIIIKHGHLHHGYFRVLEARSGVARCKVDMTGFLLFCPVIVSDSSNTVASLRGELEIRCSSDAVTKIRLDTPLLSERRFSNLLKGRFAASISKWVSFGGPQSDRSAVEFSLLAETNSPPFEVWVRYAVSGTRVPIWKGRSFLDHAAETKRVKPMFSPSAPSQEDTK